MSSKDLTVVIAFGTRPEAIKFAPVIKELSSLCKCIIINTGQHTELLDQVLDLFKIRPHYSLGCQDIDLISNFGCISKKLKEILPSIKPDLIMVQGDTLSTYAVAFVGSMEKIPVIHLESGLRSKDKFSPFPEEMYRILTDALADIYLPPTQKAKENLLNEGKRQDRIFVVGNTVIDALLYIMQKINYEETFDRLLNTLNLSSSQYKNEEKVFITAHRRENIGEPLRNICKAIKSLCSKYKDILFIWSLHRNPLVRKIIFEEFKNKPKNLVFTEALSYDLTLLLMKDSTIIFTDSGGIQEEAPTFKKPVLILRETTERMEVVETGFGFLVGYDPEKIANTFDFLIKDTSYLLSLSKKENPFGDGKATERILKLFQCEKFQQFVVGYPLTIKEDLNECKKVVDEFIYSSS